MDAEQRARVAEIRRRHRKLGTWPCTECGGPCDVQTVLAVYDAAVALLREIAEWCGWLHQINTHDPQDPNCAECGLFSRAALAGEDGR